MNGINVNEDLKKWREWLERNPERVLNPFGVCYLHQRCSRYTEPLIRFINQGSPNALEGSPNAREGSPNTREGSPNAREGSPNAREGSPNAREGSPNARETSKKDKNGSF